MTSFRLISLKILNFRIIHHSRVTVCDNSVKTDFVQVGGFELQHLEDTGTVDLVGGIPDFLRSTIGTAETSGDEFSAVFVE